MSDGFKYLFTMVDHFTKYGWIIPFKDKTSKNVLGAFKKCITTHNVPTTLQIDNGTEFKKRIMNQFWFERNIQHIFGTPYNPQHQGAVEAFKRTTQDFLIPAKEHRKDYYRLNDSICDFLLYYNDRLHSNTKVAPSKVMMDGSDKELMEKIKKNILKRRLKQR